jgi:hypothetical protein
MRINKDNKVTKTIKENIRAGPKTSLNIKSSGAEVLLLVGRKDKRTSLTLNKKAPRSTHYFIFEN